MLVQRVNVFFTEDQIERIAAQQRDAARRDYRERITLGDRLSPGHSRIFLRALNNVLATDLALFTFAQIVDGLPIADVGWDRRDHTLLGDHPLDEHEELCPGALEKARELQQIWEPSTLKFNPQLVQAYRSASEGSKNFNTRLIELVAAAIHQLAVQVFKMKLNFHQGDVDAIVNWVYPESPDRHGETRCKIQPPPTIFAHWGYKDHEIYPEAEADMVGYWAEDRILGGVPAFDRKAGGEHANVYFHASRFNVTSRIFQLRDEQQDALTEFLLADTATPPPDPCPLPVLGDGKNYVRIDVHEALIQHRVYRDPWERKPWEMEEVRKFIRRPKPAIDYPGAYELRDYINSLPLTTERVEFTESGQICDSTPGRKGEGAECHGNTSGAKAGASASPRGKHPAPDHDSAGEEPQDVCGSAGDKGSFLGVPSGGEASGSAGEKDPAGREPRETDGETGGFVEKKEVDAALPKGEDEVQDDEVAVNTSGHNTCQGFDAEWGKVWCIDDGCCSQAGYNTEANPEAGSPHSTVEGAGRGGKRRRLG